MVKQFSFTRKIDGARYGVLVPCTGWIDAVEFAKKADLVLEGTDVCSVPVIPIPQLMSFIAASLVEGDFKWRPFADEQLEAFISCGWPEQPREIPE